MKKSFVFWVEEYFYNPTFFQKILSFLLLPLSWIYCFATWLRYVAAKEEDFGVQIVSVGNLNVGGSGKTPLVTALASRRDNAAIVLRGYGRQSKGLRVVKNKQEILEDVQVSGDEAMTYAKKLPNAIVIVSENRKLGIKKALEYGVDVIFLDDAYSKHDVKKLDLLIDVQSENSACLPSGPFRERLYKTKKALVLRDGIDFKRIVTLRDAREKMSLVTAIARPQRLDAYLPAVVGKNYFEDHHAFTKQELEAILQRDGADSILVTMKDYVKMESFNLPLSLLDLELDVQESVYSAIS